MHIAKKIAIGAINKLEAILRYYYSRRRRRRRRRT